MAVLAFQKGQPRHPNAGRRKGEPNKTTKFVKEAIADAFESLGGTEGLIAWAKKSPKNAYAFYTLLLPKLIPVQVHGDPSEPLVFRVERVIVRPEDLREIEHVREVEHEDAEVTA